MKISKLLHVNSADEVSSFIDKQARVLMFFLGGFFGLTMAWIVSLLHFDPASSAFYVLALIDFLFVCWVIFSGYLVVVEYPDVEEAIKKDQFMACMLAALSLVTLVLFGIAKYLMV